MIFTDLKSVEWDTPEIVLDLAGMESCRFSEIEQIRNLCLIQRKTFQVLSMPAILYKDGRQYLIPGKYRAQQAQKAALNFQGLNESQLACLLKRLAASKFRSSFHLRKREMEMLERYGLEKTAQHAWDFSLTRLVPAFPEKDGKQTPMKGHPVFVSAHATATCCRSCLYKWHGIPEERQLTSWQQGYIIQVQMAWIQQEQLENKKNPCKT